MDSAQNSHWVTNYRWLFCAACVALLCGAGGAANSAPGDTELVSIGLNTGVSASGLSIFSQSADPVQTISADGRFVVFASSAPDLVAVPWNGMWQIYLRDRGAGTTELISVTASGLPGNEGSGVDASINADGRYVAFASNASDLVSGDTNLNSDIFVRDRGTGVTERVSISGNGAQATGGSDESSISADGRYVAFTSWASNLVAGDTNASGDVFVRDREAGTTTRISIAPDGTQAVNSRYPIISADGRYVAFVSSESPEDYGGSIFVRDRQAGATERVDLSTSGEPANRKSSAPVISADGRYVAFTSSATNLVPGDTSWTDDIFVRDRIAGTTERVTKATVGEGIWHLSISADGRYIAFDTAANMVPGDNNRYEDVFVHDRQLRTTVRASVNSSGFQGNGISYHPALSADGRFVAFQSAAYNLVPNDANTWSSNVFCTNWAVRPRSRSR
jgi:Tol biopolymer transport system component